MSVGALAACLASGVLADSRFGLDDSSDNAEAQFGATSADVHHVLESEEREEIESTIEALEAEVGVLRTRTTELDGEISRLTQERQAIQAQYNQFMRDFGY